MTEPFFYRYLRRLDMRWLQCPCQNNSYMDIPFFIFNQSILYRMVKKIFVSSFQRLTISYKKLKFQTWFLNNLFFCVYRVIAVSLLFTKSMKWLEILGEHSFLYYSQVLFATFSKKALEKKKRKIRKLQNFC